MAGGVGHTGGLTNPAPGAEDAKPVFLIPVGLPCLERGRLYKKSIKMIYKAAIALHFTPTKWKSSKVVYIPKVGKDDYAQAKSYRPISLINYLLKGLERLSVWVADTALEDKPLHIKQHGFQKGKSTETAKTPATINDQKHKNDL